MEYTSLIMSCIVMLSHIIYVSNIPDVRMFFFAYARSWCIACMINDTVLSYGWRWVGSVHLGLFYKWFASTVTDAAMLSLDKPSSVSWLRVMMHTTRVLLLEVPGLPTRFIFWAFFITKINLMKILWTDQGTSFFCIKSFNMQYKYYCTLKLDQNYLIFLPDQLYDLSIYIYIYIFWYFRFVS